MNTNVWQDRRPSLLAAMLVVFACVSVRPTLAAPAREAPQGDRLVTPLTLEVPEALDRNESGFPASIWISAPQLERWAEAWFRSHLDAPGGAPGAIVAIVVRDRVLLVRGYGVADLDTRAPVTPDTVFRAGSISKPLTATAVMQLVESGRLQVGAPVNRYLRDFQVPDGVTLLNLVTHTAGFDTRLEGTAAASNGELQPLGVYLRANLPPQVRPAGHVLSYSNHGYTLLGHLVEQVSGRRFEDYMAEHLFAPLGMRHSSFRLTDALAANAATGYEPSGSGFRRSAPIHPRIYPAAGLNTTARDMARFMMAQLNGGAVDGTRILSEAAVRAMHQQQFAQSPEMPGVAFGFFENVTRGQRTLVHGGGIRGFMSGMCLWPRQGVGLFISNNGYSAPLVQRFFAAFAERFMPRVRPAAQTARTSPPELDRFEGAYRAASQARGNLEKAGALFGGDLVIRAVGGWRPHLDLGGDAFLPTGRLAFALDKGDEPLAFAGAEGRNPSLLVTVTPLLGCEVFEKLRWHQTSRFHRELLLLFCACFLSVVLAPAGSRLLGSVARRRGWRPDAPWPPSTRDGRWARLLLFLVAAFDLLFLALLVIAFRLARDTGMLYGLPPLARFDLALSTGTAVLAIVLPFCAWRAWRRGYWSTARRVHYTVCAAAAVAFVPFLAYWNLLGY